MTTGNQTVDVPQIATANCRQGMQRCWVLAKHGRPRPSRITGR